MKKNTDFAQMKDFQELNEKELQEIRGGEIRSFKFLNKIFLKKQFIETKQGEHNGFIWCGNSYCLCFYYQ